MILDELSVRTQPRGGSVYAGIRLRGRRTQLSERRIVILVHGFNVDSKSARQTYRQFLNRLETEVWPTPLAKFGAFWGFHWPGDHQSQVMSVATFSVRIATAKDAGEQLARLIVEYLRPDQEVFFVAHSLGCRVVLEALYAITVREHQQGKPLGAPVRGVFLMAAAVPHQLCEDGRKFRRRDPERPHDWVVHSENDRILQLLFTRGEWANGENGGEAVGRYGRPGAPERWYRTVRTKLGHGDYWSEWPLVIENIPDMLGAPVPQQPPEQPEISRSAQLPSSDLATRTIDTREIGAPLDLGWEVLLQEI